MLYYNNANKFEVKFAEKISLAKDMDIYPRLEKSAQIAIDANRGYGLDMILAEAYMKKIISFSDEEFLAYARGLNGGNE